MGGGGAFHSSSRRSKIVTESQDRSWSPHCFDLPITRLTWSNKLRTTTGIPVRRSISRGHADPLAGNFLKGFGQAYARQTYGTYTSGNKGLLFKINWKHPVHPGQHVTAVMIESLPSNTTVPPFPPSSVAQELFHYFSASAGLQKSTGLVDKDTSFPGAPILNRNQQTANEARAASRTDAEPSLSRNSVDGADTTDGHPTDQASGEVDVQDRSRVRHDLSAFFQAVLDCFPDPACKREIRRFLALDESKVVMQFRKTELLKMLCAAFPLDPVRAFAASGNQLSLPELVDLATPIRSEAEQAANYDMFWWGGLRDGLLPSGFTDNLSRLDEMEEDDLLLGFDADDSANHSTDNDSSAPAMPRSKRFFLQRVRPR